MEICNIVGGIVCYLKKLLMTPHLDSHITTDPTSELLSAVLSGNRIPHDGRNVRSIMHVHLCRKDDIFRQRRVRGGNAFRRVYSARAYSTLVILVYYSGALPASDSSDLPEIHQ